MNKIFKNFLHLSIRTVTSRIHHGDIRELLWTILPTIILIIIAIPSVKLLYLMDIPVINEGPIFTFKVIGHQWFWSYEYFNVVENIKISDFLLKDFDLNSFNLNRYFSDEFDSYMLDENTVVDNGGLRLLEVDNPLYVPTNAALRFLITSIDVLHSWAVPSLGVKVDAVPGRLSQVFFIIKRNGEFYGQCSEICGVNHGFMPIKIVSVESAFFGNSDFSLD